MTAWKPLKTAPKDCSQILVRHSSWDAPSIMLYLTSKRGFIFADIYYLDKSTYPVVVTNTDGYEWAPIPE
jgi:hypothetical protein